MSRPSRSEITRRCFAAHTSKDRKAVDDMLATGVTK